MKTHAPIRLLRLAAALLLAAFTASVPAQAPSTAEPADYAGMLAVHNSTRAAVGVPPLRWSAEAAAQAQGWANQLARENCATRYNPDPQRRELYGENILRASASGPYQGFRRQPAEVAARWAEEGRLYDHATHRCRMSGGTQCGQYLQMIWETTEVVGCGRARCETGEVWVCNYTPRGLQEDLKPYGNPLPQAAAPEPVVIGALECSALPQVAPGVDVNQHYSPVP